MATISHKRKLITIEVPKTGSTSLRKSLKMVDPDVERVGKLHDTALEVRAKVGEEIWNSYTKIGFIRHPEAWMKSLQNFPMIWMVIVQNRTPYDWFVDENGEVIIDVVYRTEDLDNFFTANNMPILKSGVRKFDRSQEVLNLIGDVKQWTPKDFSRELEHYKPGQEGAKVWRRSTS